MYRKHEDDLELSHLRSENTELNSILSLRDKELDDLQAELEALKAEDAQLDDDIDTVDAHIKNTSDRNASLRTQISDIESKLHTETVLGRKIRLDLRESTVTKNSREAELASLKSHIKVLEESLSLNLKDEKELDKLLVERTKERDDKAAALRVLEDDITELRALLDAKEKEAHDHDHEAREEETHYRFGWSGYRVNGAIADLETRLRILTDDHVHLLEDIRILRDEIASLRRQLQDAEDSNARIEEEISGLEARSNSVHDHNIVLTQELDDADRLDHAQRIVYQRHLDYERHRVLSWRSLYDGYCHICHGAHAHGCHY